MKLDISAKEGDLPMSEGRFLTYTLASVLFLISVHLFHAQLLLIYNPANYLGFHTILEFLSIVIAGSIFLYGWRVFKLTRSRNYLLLSAAFFLVGMLDLFHTLSFKGMPYFFSESSIAKATWFWVVARMMEAILILVVLLLPDRRLNRDIRPAASILCIGLLSALVFYIFQNETTLPALVIEGKGTTVLKNSIEYFVSTLHFLAILIVLYRYHIDKLEGHLFKALAFTLLFLSELIFTIYQSVYDLDNFIGHLYKVIGYYYIMRGFQYMPHKIKKVENMTLESDLQRYVQEQDGLLFSYIKVGEEFIHTFCEGRLLRESNLLPSTVVNKSIQELMPVDGEFIIRFYYRAWVSGERVQFTLTHNQQFFHVSLNPIKQEDQVREVIGTITDISFVQNPIGMGKMIN
jgi:hypothetical protein